MKGSSSRTQSIEQKSLPKNELQGLKSSFGKEKEHYHLKK